MARRGPPSRTPAIRNMYRPDLLRRLPADVLMVEYPSNDRCRTHGYFCCGICALRLLGLPNEQPAKSTPMQVRARGEGSRRLEPSDVPADIDIEQVIYALERAVALQDGQAQRLHEAHDYSARRVGEDHRSSLAWQCMGHGGAPSHFAVLERRQSHGATGTGSAHRPTRRSRASRSSLAVDASTR